jgi:hypothetical protein
MLVAEKLEWKGLNLNKQKQKTIHRDRVLCCARHEALEIEENSPN